MYWGWIRVAVDDDDLGMHKSDVGGEEKVHWRAVLDWLWELGAGETRRISVLLRADWAKGSMLFC